MNRKMLSLYVENNVGVLAKISGLFSGKAYNLESLTVGMTENNSISRMTIRVKSDDPTFEQIKKQLNRCVEVIKVIDFSDISVLANELLFIKIKGCSQKEKEELFRIARVFPVSIADYGVNDVILRSIQPSLENDVLIDRIRPQFKNIEIVRGGDIAIESVDLSESGQER